MSNTNCPNCDKPECDESAMHEAWMSDHDSDEKLHAWCAAHATCFANTVNWRSRALTEKARADAAVAQAAYWPHAAMVAHTLRGRIMALDVAMQTIRGAELNKRQLQALALVERAITELQAEADRIAALELKP